MVRIRGLQSVVVCILLAMGGSAWAAQDQKPLDNAEIIKLMKLDMGDAVIIAKIKSATAVRFATETDDLVKLKDADVSREVIVAMLDRSSAETTRANGPSRPDAAAPAIAKVTLQAKDSGVNLKTIDGDLKIDISLFGATRYLIFLDRTSKIRTRDRKPAITLAVDRDPRQVYWLVRVDPEDDEEKYRSVFIKTPGMFGGVLSSAPDEDSLVECTQTEIEPGVWRFVPVKDLKPGEYGIYVGKGEKSGTLFDFGVDK